MTLPDVYTPKDSRIPFEEDPVIKYGIGIEHRPGEAGMTDGPYDTIEECLDSNPVYEKKVFIYELPSGRKLYRWHSPSWYKL